MKVYFLFLLTVATFLVTVVIVNAQLATNYDEIVTTQRVPGLTCTIPPEISGLHYLSIKNTRTGDSFWPGDPIPQGTVVKLSCQTGSTIQGASASLCTWTGQLMPSLGRCIETDENGLTIKPPTVEEQAFNSKCQKNFFTCKSDGRCLRIEYFCDGIADCRDNSDEISCFDGGRQLETDEPSMPTTTPRKKTTMKFVTTPSLGQNWWELPRIQSTTPQRKQGNNNNAQCGQSGGQHYGIFGGEKASLFEFPWLVRLESKVPGVNGMLTCDGALISPEWILTASHCVVYGATNRLAEWANVHLARYDLKASMEDENGEMQRSSVIIKHPDYVGQGNYWKNDIALIKLAEPVSYRPRIKPLCLPDNSDVCDSKNPDDLAAIEKCESDTVTVAGWGGFVRAGNNQSNILLVADLPIRSRDDCSDNFISLSKNQNCAGNGNPSTCQGDSGGPAMCKISDGRYYAVGIVSFGAASCGTPGAPSVFTRVCSFLPWIKETMANNY